MGWLIFHLGSQISFPPNWEENEAKLGLQIKLQILLCIDSVPVQVNID